MFVNSTHINDAERDGANGFATVSRPVVTERMLYPADNTIVGYEAGITVG